MITNCWQSNRHARPKGWCRQGRRWWAAGVRGRCVGGACAWPVTGLIDILRQTATVKKVSHKVSHALPWAQAVNFTSDSTLVRVHHEHNFFPLLCLHFRHKWPRIVVHFQF